MRTAIQVMAEFGRVTLRLISLHALLSSAEVESADNHAADLMGDHNAVAHSMYRERDSRSRDLMRSRHTELRKEVERVEAEAEALIKEMESLTTVGV